MHPTTYNVYNFFVIEDLERHRLLSGKHFVAQAELTSVAASKDENVAGMFWCERKRDLVM